MKYFKMISFCFITATIFSLISIFILQSVEVIGTANTDFKNLPYGIAIGINFFLFLSSFTVLLNLNEHIKTNPLWCFLSFFLLPGVFVILVFLAMWDEPWPGMLFIIPYLLVLTTTFLRFRKSVTVESVKSNF